MVPVAIETSGSIWLPVRRNLTENDFELILYGRVLCYASSGLVYDQQCHLAGVKDTLKCLWKAISIFWSTDL